MSTISDGGVTSSRGRDHTQVLVLIRSLDPGGTQAQLYALAKTARRFGMDLEVLTFYSGGAFAEKIRREGVLVASLEKRRRWDVLSFLWRLIREVRARRPDIIYAQMGMANELALLAGLLSGSRVVWGIRSAFMDWPSYDWLARLMYRLGAWLSPLPACIIFNSMAGYRHYLAAGYRNECTKVVPNGIDVEAFFPDVTKREKFRRSLGVEAGWRLIGLIGRLDVMKDHRTFLDAACLFAEHERDTLFVCIGDGPSEYRLELDARATALGLADKVLWIPRVEDMSAAYNALDILTLASIGEAFPNVIAEAMACETPCVATAVGDCREIVGDIWPLVEPKAPQKLAEAWREVLTLDQGESQRRRKEGRQRIVDKYSLSELGRGVAEVMRQVHPAKHAMRVNDQC